MLELKDNVTLKLADNYILYKLDIDQGMYWLFDIEEGTYFDLNEVSYFELSLFDGKTSFGDLSKKVISKYTLKDSDIIIKDLKDFIETLYNKSIITELK